MIPVILSASGGAPVRMRDRMLWHGEITSPRFAVTTVPVVTDINTDYAIYTVMPVPGALWIPVSYLDPQTGPPQGWVKVAHDGTVLASLATDDRGAGWLARDGAGNLWATGGSSDGTVWQFTNDGNKVSPFPTDGVAGDPPAPEDRRGWAEFAYDAVNLGVWGASFSRASNPEPRVLRWEADGTVSANVAIELGEPSPWAADESPWGLRANAGYLWTLNVAHASVSKIAPAGDGTFLGTYGVGNCPAAMAFDADGNPWVTIGGDIYRDAVLGDSTGSTPPAGSYDDSSPDTNTHNGRQHLRSDDTIDPHAVVVLDKDTGAVAHTITIGYGQPYGICYHPGQNLVFVTLSSAAQVLVFDATTRELVATLQCGRYPTGAVTDGNTIWISNTFDNTMTRIEIL